MSKEIVLTEEERTYYLNMLISMQSLIYCIDALKTSPIYKGKIKEYAQPLYIQLFKDVDQNIKKLFNVDELLSAKMIESIHTTAKLIGSKDWDVMITIEKMFKEGFEFEKYNLVEIEEKELKVPKSRT